MKSVVVILLACLVVAGCSTLGTINSRKQERAAAYEALTPEFRALVDQGQIKIGMNEDAVYIAWGKPAQKLRGESADGNSVTWVYYVSYLQSVHFVGGRRVQDAYYSGTYVHAQVVFVGGLVKSWQTFPQPVY